MTQTTETVVTESEADVIVGEVPRVATDVADYATQTLAGCAAEPRLSGGIVPRPSWRPLTRFERRGLDEGRTPTDLIYERTS